MDKEINSEKPAEKQAQSAPPTPKVPLELEERPDFNMNTVKNIQKMLLDNSELIKLNESISERQYKQTPIMTI